MPDEVEVGRPHARQVDHQVPGAAAVVEPLDAQPVVGGRVRQVLDARTPGWVDGGEPTSHQREEDLGVGSPLGANLAFILKARVQLLRDLGSAASPFNAFLVAQGLETLSLRVERHLENARAVAEHLHGHAQVTSVRWASLPDDPFHDLAQKYTPKGAGAVLSFEIDGGEEAGRRFVEGLSLHSHVANIGDVRSLAIHPWSTTHSQGADEGRYAAGVTPGLVRLAVGIEHIDDILADLEQGFAAAAG